MAVAAGTTAHGTASNTTQLTVAVTVAGSNTALVAGVAITDGDHTDDTPTASYNGVSMTLLGRIDSNQAGAPGDAGYVALFGLKAPAAGTHNLVFNTTIGNNGLCGGGTPLTGVDQTTPFDTAVTASGDNSGGSSHPTVAVTGSVSGDLIVDALCSGSSLATPNSTGTNVWTQDNNNSTAAGNGCGSTNPGGSTAAGYNPAAHDWWGLVAVNVNQAGGGGGSDHAGAVTPTAQASVSLARTQGHAASTTGTAAAGVSLARSQGHAAATTGTAKATAAPAAFTTRHAAISAAATASATPTPAQTHAAAVAPTVTATASPTATATRGAAVTGTARADLALSGAGQNSGAIAATAAATLTAAANTTRAAAIAASVRATLTTTAAAIRTAAISALVRARLIATPVGSVPPPEQQIQAHTPHLGWRVRRTYTAWHTGTARPAWRTRRSRIS